MDGCKKSHDNWVDQQMASYHGSDGLECGIDDGMGHDLGTRVACVSDGYLCGFD